MEAFFARRPYPLFALLFLSGASAFAYTTGGGEYHDLYRGARAQAMGDAFTAVADDEEAIFYNPAGLAGVDRPSIHPLIADLDLSTDLLTDSSALSSVKSLGPDTLNALMGKNIYGRAQLTPTIMMPNFGLSVIVDAQAALYTRNEALPQIVYGYQNTNGLQAAYGVSLNKSKRSSDDWRVGGAVKMLYRRGGYRLLSVQDLLALDSNSVGALAGNYEKGYGADLGSQYVHKFKNKKTQFSAGLTYRDIGDTSFGGQADPIKSNLSAGIALSHQFPLVKTTLSYDYQHILSPDANFAKKNHLGAEIALPVVSLYGGINQAFITYGASVDLVLVKITVASYEEELGATAPLDPDRRYMLRFDFKFGL